MLFLTANVFTVIDLDPLFAKDLLGTKLKKTGVSFMLLVSARGYFLTFKNLAFIKTRQIVFQLFRELLAN